MVMFVKPSTIQRVMQYQGAHAHICAHQKRTHKHVASKETFFWFVIGWA